MPIEICARKLLRHQPVYLVSVEMILVAPGKKRVVKAGCGLISGTTFCLVPSCTIPDFAPNGPLPREGVLHACSVLIDEVAAHREQAMIVR